MSESHSMEAMITMLASTFHTVSVKPTGGGYRACVEQHGVVIETERFDAVGAAVTNLYTEIARIQRTFTPIAGGTES